MLFTNMRIKNAEQKRKKMFTEFKLVRLRTTNKDWTYNSTIVIVQ